jgi:hypothetical protein
MDEITRKRLELGKDDNTQYSVIDVLEQALADLKSGKEKANKMLLLLVDTDPGKTFEVMSYCAGVSRLDTAGMLAFFQHRHIAHWRGE